MDKPAKFYRVHEFAAALNVTPACVRRWVLTRKISFVKIGGRAVRIPSTEFERLVAEGLRPAKPHPHERDRT